MKAALRNALHQMKQKLPGQLLSKLESRLKDCLPLLAESLAGIITECDNDALKVGQNCAFCGYMAGYPFLISQYDSHACCRERCVKQWPAILKSLKWLCFRVSRMQSARPRPK